MFERYRSLAQAPAAVAVCGAGLLAATAADAGVVAQVGNASVLAATNWNNGSLDFYWQAIDASGWNGPVRRELRCKPW